MTRSGIDCRIAESHTSQSVAEELVQTTERSVTHSWFEIPTLSMSKFYKIPTDCVKRPSEWKYVWYLSEISMTVHNAEHNSRSSPRATRLRDTLDTAVQAAHFWSTAPHAHTYTRRGLWSKRTLRGRRCAGRACPVVPYPPGARHPASPLRPVRHTKFGRSGHVCARGCALFCHRVVSRLRGRTAAHRSGHFVPQPSRVLHPPFHRQPARPGGDCHAVLAGRALAVPPFSAVPRSRQSSWILPRPQSGTMSFSGVGDCVVQL